MAELKFTKQELRLQQTRVTQLQEYLPTLKLRKALLQAEVIAARTQWEELRISGKQHYDELMHSAALITLDPTLCLDHCANIATIDKGSENIAGVELPTVKGIVFQPFHYDLYDTPPWLDCLVEQIRSYRLLQLQIEVADERIRILTRELRDVAIRVNLFEKVLIPRCMNNIKSIKIFLGDLQLAAVSQAKIAKMKILTRKQAEVMI